MSTRPTDVRYTRTHEWIRIEGETATVGITDFAVEHLGDLVFVDLPEEGHAAAEGESVAEVESVKAVGEVNAPVAGEVTAVNAALAGDQSDLKDDPFGAGWLWKMTVAPGAGDDLMDLEAYENFLSTEDALS